MNLSSLRTWKLYRVMKEIQLSLVSDMVMMKMTNLRYDLDRLDLKVAKED